MDPGRNKNYARGAAASGARARGRRRCNYQTQGAGGRGNHKPTAEMQWVNRSPNQAHSGANKQPWGDNPPQLQTPHQGMAPLGGRVDAWTGRSWGQPRTPSSPSVQPQSQPRPRPRSSFGMDRFAFYVFLLLVSLLWCELFGCNYLVKPNKIVVFRDGVSEGQFEMVLAEKLCDLKNAIYYCHYQPKITLIVAQKRHQARFVDENRNDVWASGNVPPGTVMDTKVVHPSYFDFYCAAIMEVLVLASLLTTIDGVCFEKLQRSIEQWHLPRTEQPQLHYLLRYLTRVYQSFYNLHSADLENFKFFV